MTQPYVHQIDERIAALKKQIEDLEITRRVLLTLIASAGAPEHTRSTTEHTREPAKQQPKPAKQPIVRGPHVQKELIKDIHAVLSQRDAYGNKAMFSREIIEALNWQGKKQRVWAALSVMKKNGTVVHDSEFNTYSLPYMPRERNDVAVSNS